MIRFVKHSELSSFALQAETAFNEALVELKARRARDGKTMVVWQDGHVCHVHPDAPALIRESSPNYQITKPAR